MASVIYTVTAAVSCLQSNSSSWQNTAIATPGCCISGKFRCHAKPGQHGRGHRTVSGDCRHLHEPCGHCSLQSFGIHRCAQWRKLCRHDQRSLYCRPQLPLSIADLSGGAYLHDFCDATGFAEITLGAAFAFRSEQSGVSSLNNWAIHSEVGSQTVCSFAVAALSLPAPVVSLVNPASGTQGQTLSAVIAGSNFQNGAACSFGSGITINSCTVNSPAQITSTITIIGSAATGPRGVTSNQPRWTIRYPGQRVHRQRRSSSVAGKSHLFLQRRNRPHGSRSIRQQQQRNLAERRGVDRGREVRNCLEFRRNQ